MKSRIRNLVQMESATGILLVASAVLAMVAANSPLSVYYDMMLGMPVEVRVGPLLLAKPLLLWINDGLMAIFFFHVGLELKREMLDGGLSDMRGMALPVIGALGGMAVPAAIYLAINGEDPITRAGWAIPAATDIAFSLGVLMLFGRRVPPALKVFLVSLAIFDDVGAIIVIALFYTGGLSTSALAIALICLSVLFVCNRRGVAHHMPYFIVGGVMWVAVLKSGVHATLAGMLLALFIPLRDTSTPGRSPLRELEKDLHGSVNFAILPLFAFVNAGIPLAGMGADFLLNPVSGGVAAGLFIGKQAGVFVPCWLAIKSGLARMPEGVSAANLYGVSALCGIGFTMSLFIGSLAFEQGGIGIVYDERVGIIVGSLVSAALGSLVLHLTLKAPSGK